MITKDFPFAVVPGRDGLGDRQIEVRASDFTEDRVHDRLVPKGCFSRKSKIPVLTNHDSSIESIVGEFEFDASEKEVSGIVTFLPPGISAKADDACAKYKGGFATDVSVGFSPVEYEPNGKGITYKKWELIELSLVVTGCNPNAITTAKSADHAMKWKCGASLNLDVVEDELTCDAIEDERLSRKANLAYSADGGRAIQFATMKDGRLVTSPSLVSAARDALDEMNLPDDVVVKAQAALDHYEMKAGRTFSASNAEKIAAACDGAMNHIGSIKELVVPSDNDGDEQNEPDTGKSAEAERQKRLRIVEYLERRQAV